MQGLERCPFLREVAEREGQQYAAHIACRPTVPFVRSAKPVLREDECDFAATFQLFHGPAGVVPLRSGILSSGALCCAATNVALPRRLGLPLLGLIPNSMFQAYSVLLSRWRLSLSRGHLGWRLACQWNLHHCCRASGTSERHRRQAACPAAQSIRRLTYGFVEPVVRLAGGCHQCGYPSDVACVLA